MDNTRAIVCPICAGTAFSCVRTYKHDWHQCDRCGTVQRERRPHYPLDVAPVRWLVKNTILDRIFGSTILREHEVVAEEKTAYDLYDRVVADGTKGTKWEPLPAMRLADFVKQGIDISGKSVLEISGGPGFLAREVQKTAKRVVVTEFSDSSAESMLRHLGVQAIRYDYNSDNISDSVSGLFDIVVIIYSIGYCKDLRSFLRSLKNVMHENSVIYVCHSPGTLGLMLRWQFDEYTLIRCWNEDVLAACFAEIGYPERARESEGDISYDFQWYDDAGTRVGAFLKRLHHVVARYYRVRALRAPGRYNRELVQKHFKQVFGKG
ncbi:MAG: Methyltransferase domain [Pseudomonadota bacterium]